MTHNIEDLKSRIYNQGDGTVVIISTINSTIYVYRFSMWRWQVMEDGAMVVDDAEYGEVIDFITPKLDVYMKYAEDGQSRAVVHGDLTVDFQIMDGEWSIQEFKTVTDQSTKAEREFMKAARVEAALKNLGIPTNPGW